MAMMGFVTYCVGKLAYIEVLFPQNIRQHVMVLTIIILDNFILICLCDVTLSVYPHRAGLKNMPGHGGIRTYDLWNTSPMPLPTELRGQVGLSVRYFGTESSSFDVSVI